MRNEVGEKLGSGPWSEQDLRPQQGISLRGLAAVVTQPKMVALLWVLAIVHLGWIFSRLPQRENKIDFGYYYVGLAALHQGLNPYTAKLLPLSHKLGLEIDPPIQIAETPFFLLTASPLALLRPKTAYWVWWSASFLALCVSLILLLRRVGAGALALGALMLLYHPLTDHLLLAQSQLLVLLLLVLLLLALEKKNDVAAGAILALAGALRAYPLAMGAYLLLTGRWRALRFTIIFLAIIACTTVAVLGWRLSISWIHSALVATGDALNPEDLSINAFVSRFFWYDFGTTLSRSLEFYRYGAIALAEIALLGSAAWATLLSPDRFGFSIWVVVAIVLSPIAWVHFLVLLFIPFCELASAANQGTSSGRAINAMIASYVLTTALCLAMGFTPTNRDLYRWIWIGQGFSISVLLAYLSVYWLAVDHVRPG